MGEGGGGTQSGKGFYLKSEKLWTWRGKTADFFCGKNGVCEIP